MSPPDSGEPGTNLLNLTANGNRALRSAKRDVDLAKQDEAARLAVERGDRWGYVRFNGERLFCLRVDSALGEKLVLIPGGPVFLDAKVTPAPAPDAKGLALALTELSEAKLQAISRFCAEPRTMEEINAELSDSNCPAWYLRRLGILRDAGRRGRRIVSVWSGYDYDRLLTEVRQMSRD